MLHHDPFRSVVDVGAFGCGDAVDQSVVVEGESHFGRTCGIRERRSRYGGGVTAGVEAKGVAAGLAGRVGNAFKPVVFRFKSYRNSIIVQKKKTIFLVVSIIFYNFAPKLTYARIAFKQSC